MVKFSGRRQSLQNKLIIAFVLTLLIPTIIIAVYSITSTTNSILATTKNSNLKDSQTHVEETVQFLERVKTDALFQGQDPAVLEYVDALLSNDEVKIGLAKTALQNVFVSFAQSANIYSKVRFLDTSGQEVVRVDYADG